MKQKRYKLISPTGEPFMVSTADGLQFRGTLDEAYAMWQRYQLTGWRIRPS